MKERPILFSTPMVQAILKGEKAQTRRTRGLNRMNEAPDNWKLYVGDFYTDKKGRLNQKFFNKHGHSDHAICPYGQPGDLLYVRETWNKANDFIDDGRFIYKEKFVSMERPAAEAWRWRPSIHMPKAAARIWLQVEEVKVERLQDISDDSIIAEGVRIPVNGIGTNKVVFKLGVENSAFSFLPERKEGEKYNQSQLLHAFWAELWCEVNGRASWDLNPWVWVVKFKLLSTTGKPDLTMNNSNLKTEIK